jgi:uroporphyrinogen-III decarboxylase
MGERIVPSRSELDAYCSDHGVEMSAGGTALFFPGNFVTEAAALGAAVNRTSRGHESVAHFINDAAALSKLPDLAGTETVHRLLERIRAAPKNRPLCLTASGPYSILASLSEPKLFYRWHVKEAAALHAALEKMTASVLGYISATLDAGVRIVSLADPYADFGILGEERYRCFATDYLYRLVERLRTAYSERPLLIHICPRSFIPMRQLGYFAAINGAATGVAATDTAFRNCPVITGNRCIHDSLAVNNEIWSFFNNDTDVTVDASYNTLINNIVKVWGIL